LMSVVPKRLYPQPVFNKQSASANPGTGAVSGVNQIKRQYEAAKHPMEASVAPVPQPALRVEPQPEPPVAVPVVVIEEPELDFAPVDAALLLCADAVQQARLRAPAGGLDCVDDAVTVCLDVIAKEVQKLNSNKSSSRLSLWQQPECAREPMSEATAVALSKRQATAIGADCGQITMVMEPAVPAENQTTKGISKGRARRKVAAQEKLMFVPPAPKPLGPRDEQPAAAAPQNQASKDASRNKRQGEVLRERRQVSVEFPRGAKIEKLSMDKAAVKAPSKTIIKSRSNAQQKGKDSEFVPPAPKPRK
jgi:hypothetical protein